MQGAKSKNARPSRSALCAYCGKARTFTYWRYCRPCIEARIESPYFHPPDHTDFMHERERRIALYCQRAALELPLFEKSPSPPTPLSRGARREVLLPLFLSATE